jgi:hypothetical protein
MLHIGKVGPGYAPSLSKWLVALAMVAVTATGYATTLPNDQSAVDVAAKARIIDQYGKLHLSFEENRGQVANEVKYLSRGSGHSMFFTPREAVMSLKARAASPGATHAVRLRFVGANTHASISAAQPLPGKSNYFIGNDPQKWRIGVPQFAQIKYQGLYPGVDLVYYGNQRQLEFDFIIAPRVNPQVIRLSFSGVDRLNIEPNGDLVLKTKAGDLKQQKPHIYQQVAGVKKTIDGSYVQTGKTQIGFKVAAYDRSEPLVIDPVVLSYSTFLGGTGDDQGNAIAVDTSNNAYIAGQTTSADFPGASGVVPSGTNAFVARLNATGAALDYATYLGGSLSDQANAIAVDSSGTAYVTGQTASTDFPIFGAVFQPAASGGLGNDAFVTALNNGGAIVYSTYLGGTNDDVANGIAVSGGAAFVTGTTKSNDFRGASSRVGSARTDHDAFVAMIGANGLILNYSFYVGGIAEEFGNGIAVDSSGIAYVTGSTASTGLGTTGVAQLSFAGGATDAFVASRNATDGSARFFTYLGGNSADVGTGIALDGSNNIYIVGSTTAQSTANTFPVTPNAAQFAPGNATNGSDAFVAKLNSSGTVLVYATYLGGSTDDAGGPGNDFGRAIAIDTAGNAYVAGDTSARDFPTRNAQKAALLPGDGSDGFVAKLSPDGSFFIYSTYLGGSNLDFGLGIAVDSAGSAYVTGSAGSTDFPTTAGVLQPSMASQAAIANADSFVAKYGASSATNVTIVSSTSGTSTVGQAVTFTITITGTAPGGMVNCFDGSIAFARNVAITNGSATCTISALTAGTHSITATYSGDANLAGGSSTITQTVNAASGGGSSGGGGCTVNSAGTLDWTLLLMLAAAGIYRLRRSKRPI